MKPCRPGSRTGTWPRDGSSDITPFARRFGATAGGEGTTLPLPLGVGAAAGRGGSTGGYGGSSRSERTGPGRGCLEVGGRACGGLDGQGWGCGHGPTAKALAAAFARRLPGPRGDRPFDAALERAGPERLTGPPRQDMGPRGLAARNCFANPARTGWQVLEGAMARPGEAT